MSGRAVKVASCLVAVVAGLATAIIMGIQAYTAQTRPPTAAEFAAAAQLGIAQRWERLSAGDIYPATVLYQTSLRTTEKATRLGIVKGDGCEGAVDPSLKATAAADGCLAGMRATYADELGGTVYTVGVLAFATPSVAATFAKSTHPGAYPVAGLHASAFNATASARFTDQTRQAEVVRTYGPYVLMVVAGYADGRAATPRAQQPPHLFGPAAKLAQAIGSRIDAPMIVHCGTADWTCLAASEPLSATAAGGVRAANMAVLSQIDVPAAWRSSEGAGITVAVLDTGVSQSAADLSGSVTTGPDYATGTEKTAYQPPRKHGTYIASLIAGHGNGAGDSSGVLGVAPQAKILDVRVVLDSTEPGQRAYDASQQYDAAIASGISYAVAHGAKVINMSLGTTTPSAALRAALARAAAAGVVLVASAGNDGTSAGSSPYMYPASFPGVISVGATSSPGQPAAFSARNSSVEIAAPGVAVPGDGPSGYLSGTGTSASAALVSGVAALIESRYPKLSPALVAQALTMSTSHRPAGGYGTATGFGELDAAAALKAAAGLAVAHRSLQVPSGTLFGVPAGDSGPHGVMVVHRNGPRLIASAILAVLGSLVALAGLTALPIVLRRRPGPAAPAGTAQSPFSAVTNQLRK